MFYVTIFSEELKASPPNFKDLFITPNVVKFHRLLNNTSTKYLMNAAKVIEIVTAKLSRGDCAFPSTSHDPLATAGTSPHCICLAYLVPQTAGFESKVMLRPLS